MTIRRTPRALGVMPKRTLSESHKKIVAANHDWKCNACRCVLPPSFQIDHIVPLWKGGDDTVENSQSLCGTCHANKTQLESIERARMEREKRVALAKQRQEEYEKSAQADEASRPAKKKGTFGQTPLGYNISDEENPFLRFMYTQ